MRSSATNFVIALGWIVLGIAIGAGSIYVAQTDDAPGAALFGFLLMMGAVALGVRTLRRRA